VEDLPAYLSGGGEIAHAKHMNNLSGARIVIGSATAREALFGGPRLTIRGQIAAETGSSEGADIRPIESLIGKCSVLVLLKYGARSDGSGSAESVQLGMFARARARRPGAHFCRSVVPARALAISLRQRSQRAGCPMWRDQTQPCFER
jgi:hypothetical protein